MKIALQFALSSHRSLTSLPDSIQKRDSWQCRFISGVLTTASSGAIVRVYTSLLRNFVRGFIFPLLFLFYCFFFSLSLSGLFRNLLVTWVDGGVYKSIFFFSFQKSMAVLQIVEGKVPVAYLPLADIAYRTPCSANSLNVKQLHKVISADVHLNANRKKREK